MYLPIWRPLIGRICVCLPVGLLLHQNWTRLSGSGLLAALGLAYLEACCQLIPALLTWRPQDARFPYSRWKQSCTTWEHHALDPRAPILILASSFWAELLGFGWKESCTTPHSSTLNSGGTGGEHQHARLILVFWRWCRIVSIDRLRIQPCAALAGQI